jgi:hypothetical protein
MHCIVRSRAGLPSLRGSFRAPVLVSAGKDVYIRIGIFDRRLEEP